MKFKRLLFSIISFFFLVTNTSKPIANANNINNLKNEGTKIALKLANSLSDETDTDDPNEIFSRALNRYLDDFDSYLNITGLNVFDKKDITLPNFDINYVPSPYYTIMNDYELNFQNQMSHEELSKYNNLRRENAYFDKHITLIETKYRDLKVQPKFNPNIDIEIPFIDHTRSIALTTILAGAGLSEAIISAFTGCTTALSSALATSWIPIVGWAIAVGIVTGALIALTVIIVQNWESIRLIIIDIKMWFLQEFAMFAQWINSFFADATAKGQESTLAREVEAGGKTLSFYDVVVDAVFLSKIVDDCRRNNNIWLLGHIGNAVNEVREHWWICYDKVSEDFVTSNKLYDLGICTYTWYNNIAKRMMANGSIKINGDYTLLIYERTIDQGDVFGWNHYHLGERNGDAVEKIDERPWRWAHSLFGLLRIKENGNYNTYPTNP